MRLTRFLVLPCLLAAMASCATTGGGSRSSGGSSSPDFTLPSVDGRPTRLSSYLGKKAILMNFWATWCGPCMQELPHLQALYDKYKAQDFEVISIAMDDPTTVAAVPPKVRQMGLNFTVLLDTESRATALYNPTLAAPFNVFIDKSGKVVLTRSGYEAGDDAVIEELVVSRLLSSNVPAASSAPVAQ